MVRVASEPGAARLHLLRLEFSGQSGTLFVVPEAKGLAFRWGGAEGELVMRLDWAAVNGAERAVNLEANA